MKNEDVNDNLRRMKTGKVGGPDPLKFGSAWGCRCMMVDKPFH